MAADATCANHGSIWIIDPVSPAAEAWMDEHIPEGATWLHGALAVEHRYGPDIIRAMRGDGLRVEGTR